MGHSCLEFRLELHVHPRHVLLRHAALESGLGRVIQALAQPWVIMMDAKV